MNFNVDFLWAYFLPGADMTNLPDIVVLMVTSLINSQWVATLALPPARLNFATLRQLCSFPLSAGKKGRGAIDTILGQHLATWLQDSPDHKGYYFDTPGAIQLPSGAICFLRGGELIGECGRPYYVAPELRKIRLLGNDDPPTQFYSLLANCKFPVLLAVGAAAHLNDDKRYLSELKSVAACYGYSGKAIDRLLSSGFSTDEIEEFIYCGEV